MKVEVPGGALKIFERVRSAVLNSSRSVGDVVATHENNFNIVRFILAASVIYFHAPHIVAASSGDWITRNLLFPVTDLGGMAVQCFFFLSGLFVSQSIVKDRHLLDYTIKRIMRIFPGLFACTVVMTVILAMLSGWESFSRLFRTSDPYTFILSNGSLNLRWTLPTVLDGNPFNTLNGSIHTLPTELKMYVMLGLFGLFGIASRRLWLGLTTTLLLIIAIFVGRPVTTMIWHAVPDAYAMIMMFLVGILVFVLADYIYINLAQGVVFLSLIVLCKHVFMLRYAATYGFAIWALLCVGQQQSLRRLFKPKYDTSYGIYIYGWPSQQLVKAIIPSIGAGLNAILALVLALVFALMSWIYVERPAMEAAKVISKSSSKLRAIREVFSWRRGGFRSLYIQFCLVVMCAGMALLSANVHLIQREAMSSHIVAWGPSSAKIGHGFNIQPDGSWAIWIKLDGEVPPDSTIMLDGHQLKTTIMGDRKTLTAAVPKWLIRHPGNKRIEVYSLDIKGAYQSNSVSLNIFE